MTVSPEAIVLSCQGSMSGQPLRCLEVLSLLVSARLVAVLPHIFIYSKGCDEHSLVGLSHTWRLSALNARHTLC